jgi:hypothetical protein
MKLARFGRPCQSESRMPKRAGKKLDVVQNARRVVDESLRRFEETQQEPNPAMISQVMAAMDRKGGKLGGKTRMENLGVKGRSALGRAAVQARWAKYRAQHPEATK